MDKGTDLNIEELLDDTVIEPENKDQKLPTTSPEDDASEGEDGSNGKNGEDIEETEEDEGEEDEESTQPQKLSRATTRIQNVLKQRAEARAAKAEADAENARLKTQLDQVIAAQRAAEQVREQELLAGMTSDEQREYKHRQEIQAVRGDLDRLVFEQKDALDRQVFQLKAAQDAVYGRYADKVELELGRMRQKGLNAPREELLAYIIGKDVMSRAQSKNAKSQSKIAAERVAAAKGKGLSPRNGSGTVPKTGKTAEDRLTDVFI